MNAVFVRQDDNTYARCRPQKPQKELPPSLTQFISGGGGRVGKPGPPGPAGPPGPPGDLSFVATDATLTGDGTIADPLSVVPPNVDGGIY